MSETDPNTMTMGARGKITLLTFFFAICGTAAVLTAARQMNEDANVKPADLYSVVQRQLGEFHGGNFSGAYEYASSAVQHEFSVDQFANMVQSQYSNMMHVSRAEYGNVLTKGRHATIEVYLIDEFGEVTPCVYMMVREGDGWRIDGARMMQPWPPEMHMEGTTL
jgi:hypothetical protein